MGANTKIQWCSHSWNPWRGCVEVSPGCDHCYARELAKRNPAVLGVWGHDGTRPLGKDAYWRLPYKWNEEAMEACEERRVFLGSLMDFFEEREDLKVPRFNACRVMYDTPFLTYLLLTKRAWNIDLLWERSNEAYRYTPNKQDDYLPPNRLEPRNVIFGTTVENQEWADKRIPYMQDLERAGKRTFLSVEPMLEMIDLDKHFADCPVSWVIVGGESGPGSRPIALDWIDDIVGTCKKYSVPVFVKQLGQVTMVEDGHLMRLTKKQIGEFDDFPAHLQVREFPVDWMVNRDEARQASPA